MHTTHMYTSEHMYPNMGSIDHDHENRYQYGDENENHSQNDLGGPPSGLANTTERYPTIRIQIFKFLSERVG